MIKQYIIIPDLFAFFISIIILMNIYSNERGYKTRTKFIKRIWLLISGASVFSMIINTFKEVTSINPNVYNVLYAIFLSICSFIVLDISIFILKVLHLNFKEYIFIKKILYIFFSINIILNFSYKLTGLKPSENMILNPNATGKSLNSNFILITLVLLFFIVLFFKSKNNIIKKIYTNFAYFGPMALSLVIFDLIIQMTNQTSFYYTIIPISLSGIAVNFFIIFYSQPYNKKFGTFGQDTFNAIMADNLLEEEKITIINLSIENSNEIENNFSKEHLENIFLKIILYINEIPENINIFKIRDSIILQIKNNINPVTLINDMKSQFDKITNIPLIYKLTLVEIEKTIHSIKEYYSLQNLLTKKCHFNNYYIGKKSDIQKIYNETIIEKELIDIVNSGNLNDERIVLNLQPIYNYKTKSFNTAEALIRLNSKELGLVFPDEFIHIAEKLDIIHEITKIVINKSCICLNKMKEHSAKIDAITVNVSPREILKDNFSTNILEIIRNNNIEIQQIRLEFLESFDVFDYTKVKEHMNMLSENGIKFYLDDFGSGYSNLDKIISLPFSTIKFDKSIVWGAINNRKKYTLLKELTRIFKHFKMNVVFEGIENEQYETLATSIGVYNLQGYKYSKPILSDDAIAFFIN